MVFRIDCEGCEAVIPFAPSPRRGSADHPGQAGAAWGFAAGTQIATAAGWRVAEDLVPGDSVLTFENGPRTLREVWRGRLWRGAVPCPSPLWPLFVPQGALGNVRPMTLLPEQRVLVESDVARGLYGDPFVLLPARLLSGQSGIRPMPQDRAVEVVMPIFDAPEIVFADGATLVRCPHPDEREAQACARPEMLHDPDRRFGDGPSWRLLRSVSPVLQPDEIGLFLDDVRRHAAWAPGAKRA